MMWLSGVRSSCLRLGFKWELDLLISDHKSPSQGYHVKSRQRIQANYPLMTRWAATESERKAAYSEDPRDVRFLRQRHKEECGRKCNAPQGIVGSEADAGGLVRGRGPVVPGSLKS